MDYDDAYANAAHIPGAETYPPRWEEAARDWRQFEYAIGRARLNLAYGDDARERFDLFLPAGRAQGVVVFVHGGYWRAFDNKSWSHLAAGPTARGWAVAMPAYTLAPQARISQITRQIARAVTTIAGIARGPVVLTGHSAGGHLVARQLCRDVVLPDEVRQRFARVVPISPLSDLRPLMQTSMNADLRLDAAEAEAESPVLCPDPLPVPVSIWVGGDERPAFLDQARWLAEAWPEAELHVEAGRHHFNVIDALEDPQSALTDLLLS